MRFELLLRRSIARRIFPRYISRNFTHLYREIKKWKFDGCSEYCILSLKYE